MCFSEIKRLIVIIMLSLITQTRLKVFFKFLTFSFILIFSQTKTKSS